MALDRDMLEEQVVDALTINLSEADKIPEVMDPIEAYAAALTDAIHTYIQNAVDDGPIASRSWHSANDDS